MGYDELTEPEQLALLARVAAAASPRFGAEAASVELVAHAYNTTFSARGPSGRVALRVHTNSHSTPGHVHAQHAWIGHLARAGVAVPVPLPTRDGAPLTEIDHDGRRWTVTAARWLEGPDLTALDVGSATALGGLTAWMHDLAVDFTLPEGGELPSYDEPLFGDRNLLETWPGWSATEASIVAEAFARTRETHRRLAEQGHAIPCHADLYAANLKWVGDRLGVLDFDDMGLTDPAVDLATTIFHIREQPSSGEVEAALLRGYAEVRPLPPGATGPDLEALVAGRQLLLTNSLLLSTTWSFRDAAAEALAILVTRLQAWLDIGRFSAR